MAQSKRASCRVADVAGSALYVPAGQVIQIAELVVGAYAPAPHITQADADHAPSAGLYLPTTQSEQYAEDVAPIDALYLPLPQDVQRSAPENEKVPERQVAQSASASWAEATLAASAR